MGYSRTTLFRRVSATTVLSLCAIANSTAQTVGNPDVFALASLVADEIELVREVMGRPFDDSPRLPASNVSQFEVYFQAQTLFRKANQLAQEYAGTERIAAPAIAGRRASAPPTPTRWSPAPWNKSGW